MGSTEEISVSERDQPTSVISSFVKQSDCRYDTKRPSWLKNVKLSLAELVLHYDELGVLKIVRKVCRLLGKEASRHSADLTRQSVVCTAIVDVIRSIWLLTKNKSQESFRFKVLGTCLMHLIKYTSKTSSALSLETARMYQLLMLTLDSDIFSTLTVLIACCDPEKDDPADLLVRNLLTDTLKKAGVLPGHKTSKTEMVVAESILRMNAMHAKYATSKKGNGSMIDPFNAQEILKFIRECQRRLSCLDQLTEDNIVRSSEEALPIEWGISTRPELLEDHALEEDRPEEGEESNEASSNDEEIVSTNPQYEETTTVGENSESDSGDELLLSDVELRSNVDTSDSDSSDSDNGVPLKRKKH